jgi:S1-C subfamily serine protease
MRKFRFLRPPSLLRRGFFCIALAASIGTSSAHEAEPVEVIARLKQSVVGIGTFDSTRAPRLRLLGSGFVVAGGKHVVTNFHVVPPLLRAESRESLVVVIGRGEAARAVPAATLGLDEAHDLALLSVDGPALTAAVIGDSDAVREGRSLLFTGYPIGAVFGPYPVTHRAMVSSVTPVVRPGANARQLRPQNLKRLADGGFDVFQLDATAYPGNSGSPLYDPVSGEVLGVLSMVAIKSSKESALSAPTGISYAMPSRFVQALIREFVPGH